MNEKDSKEWVRGKQDEIIQAIRSNAEQRKDAAKELREYYFAIITTAGVIAGALVVLLSTDSPQIKSFTVLSLVLQLVVISLCFAQFRSGLRRSEKIVRYIRKVDRAFSNLSYWMTKFQRDEIDQATFKEKWDVVYGQYETLRGDENTQEIEKEEDKVLDKQRTAWDTFNVIFYLFLTSLVSVAIALITPYIPCLR